MPKLSWANTRCHDHTDPSAEVNGVSIKNCVSRRYKKLDAEASSFLYLIEIKN